MKNLLKVAAVAAMIAPSMSFAQSTAATVLAANYSDAAAGITGKNSLPGDGATANGGLGWTLATNVSYNEVEFDFNTAGEVFVAIQQNKAMMAASAINLGGKGSIFHVTSAGFSGRCLEDQQLALTVDATDTPVSRVFDGASFLDAAAAHTIPAITFSTPDDLYIIAACTPIQA